MKEILRYLVLLILATGCSVSHAQIPNIQRPQLTANAMSMQRYADIPVSLYTGTPDITIPIDTVDNFRMRLPITLSYHCGGVKVDEHPGWTGLGWTLNVGGVITREVRDEIDEYVEGEPIDGKMNVGFFYSRKYLADTLLWTPQGSEDRTALSKTFGILKAADTEPDKFNFSFDGYTGFFVMDTDGSWKVYCDRPLKVKDVKTGPTPQPGEVPLSRSVKIIRSITLTGDDGTDYVFGDDAIDMSILFTNQENACWCPTAWHMKRITCPDHSEITFHYERGAYTAHIGRDGGLEAVTIGKETYIAGGAEHYNGQLLSPVYLRRINGETFSVELYRSESTELNYTNEDYSKLIREGTSSGSLPYYLYEKGVKDINDMVRLLKWQQLDSLVVLGADGNRLRKAAFSYSSIPRQRLTLMSVNMSGMLDAVDHAYKFEYSDVGCMPEYMSSAKDHWGFYNAVNYTGSDRLLGRLANPSTLVYGSLRMIHWPTGGKTMFEFEPHTYARQLSLRSWEPVENTPITFVGGGLRIRKIIDLPDNSSTPTVRTFLYVQNYKGQPTDTLTSGILEGCAIYSMRTSDNMMRMTYEAGSSEPLMPCSNSLGYAVCYPEVVELYPLGGWRRNLFTSLLDHEYANEAPVDFNWYTICKNQYTSTAQYRGKLKLCCTYNSKGFMQGRTVIEYEPLNNVKTFSGALQLNFNPLRGEKNDLLFQYYSFYKTYTYKLVEKARTEYAYAENTNDSVWVSTKHSYNDFGQVKEQTSTCHKALEVTTASNRLRYAWESDDNFKAHNFLSLVSEAKEERNGIKTKTSTNTYRLTLDSMPVPYIASTKVTDGQSAPKTTYECIVADRMGYPVFVIDANKVPFVYLWNTDRSCPIAEIKNATYIDVSRILGFAAALAPEHSATASMKLVTLKEMLPEAYVTMYSYIPHVGVSSITDNRGNSEIYEYDLMGRLQAVRNEKGEKVVTGKYTMFTSSDNTSESQDFVAANLDKCININGPREIPPNSTRTYWTGMDCGNFVYKWSLSGDTANARIINYAGDKVMLQGGSNANTNTSAVLSLNIYNRDGMLLCKKSREITFRKPEIEMFVNILNTTRDSVILRLTVHSIDDSKIYKAFVYCNGKMLQGITRDTDEMYSSGHSGVRSNSIVVKRHQTVGLYQLSASTGPAEVTKEMTYEDLFEKEP